jgi:hypothetical protein
MAVISLRALRQGVDLSGGQVPCAPVCRQRQNACAVAPPRGDDAGRGGAKSSPGAPEAAQRVPAGIGLGVSPAVRVKVSGASGGRFLLAVSPWETGVPLEVFPRGCWGEQVFLEGCQGLSCSRREQVGKRLQAPPQFGVQSGLAPRKRGVALLHLG